jgi:hypothetical protein
MRREQLVLPADHDALARPAEADDVRPAGATTGGSTERRTNALARRTRSRRRTRIPRLEHLDVSLGRRAARARYVRRGSPARARHSLRAHVAVELVGRHVTERERRLPESAPLPVRLAQRRSVLLAPCHGSPHPRPTRRSILPNGSSTRRPLEMVATGTRALEIAGRLGDLKLRIVTTTSLAWAHYLRGEYARAIELATDNIAALPADCAVTPHWRATLGSAARGGRRAAPGRHHLLVGRCRSQAARRFATAIDALLALRLTRPSAR